MGNETIGRWESFTMGFAVGFLGVWNKKKIIFPALFVVMIALFAWYWYLPTLLSLVLFLVVLITTVLLGLTGLITMPMVARDLSRTVRVVTGTLAVIIPVIVILLAFTFWMMWPVLFVAAEPDLGEGEFDMEVEKVIMENYKIEGPKDCRGMRTTRIAAVKAEMWNFTVYYGDKTVSSPHATIDGLDMYCTYIRGTGEALRVSSATAWYGDESPPFIFSLMVDPVEMTDVKMHVVYQEVKSIEFDDMTIQDKDAASLQMIPMTIGNTRSNRIYIPGEHILDNSFTIRAKKMEMNIDLMDLLLGMLDLRALLSMEMAIPAKNVVMVNGTIKVPYPNGENVLVSFDESHIDIADMKLTTINALKMIVGDLIEMVLGMLGRRVVLEDVTIVGEWMKSTNIQLKGFNMKSDSDLIFGDGTTPFTIEMNGMGADSMTITGINRMGDVPYMIVDARGFVADEMLLTIPDGENEIKITAEVKGMRTSELWAFEIITENGTMSAMEITELPHKLDNTELSNMNNVTIEACFMNTEDVDLTGMAMVINPAQVV